MNLTREELAFFTGLLKYKPIIHNGYYYFRPKNKIYGCSRYKRSRVRLALWLNRKLTIHEKVRFKDGNTLNDSLNNLFLE